MKSVDFEFESEGDDHLVLHYKFSPDRIAQCEPEVCVENGWEGVTFRAKKSTVELEPGFYYYKYEARKTKGNTITLTGKEGVNNILNRVITIGESGLTIGCGVFRVRP